MFYVKLVFGRASNDACHEIFSRQVAQMLRNGLRIITAVICGACIIYVHPDIAYQGAIMRRQKRVAWFAGNVFLLGSGSKSEVEGSKSEVESH